MEILKEFLENFPALGNFREKLENFGGIWGVFLGNLWEFCGTSLEIVWGCMVGFWFGIFWPISVSENVLVISKGILWKFSKFFANIFLIFWELFGNLLEILVEFFENFKLHWHKVVKVTWNDAIFDLMTDKDNKSNP